VSPAAITAYDVLVCAELMNWPFSDRCRSRTMSGYSLRENGRENMALLIVSTFHGLHELTVQIANRFNTLT
jgi:hypothetical protein